MSDQSQEIKVVKEGEKTYWSSGVVGWTKKQVIRLDAEDFPVGTVIEFVKREPDDT